jgi:hypothetical protein
VFEIEFGSCHVCPKYERGSWKGFLQRPVLAQWRQWCSFSISLFTSPKLREPDFSPVSTFALPPLLLLNGGLLLMICFPPAIEPIPLLAAAAMIGAVPSARVAAADLFVLLPGFVISVRLFCPRSTVPRNRHVADSCCSSRLLQVISLSCVTPAKRRLQLKCTGGKVNGVTVADGH